MVRLTDHFIIKHLVNFVGRLDLFGLFVLYKSACCRSDPRGGYKDVICSFFRNIRLRWSKRAFHWRANKNNLSTFQIPSLVRYSDPNSTVKITPFLFQITINDLPVGRDVDETIRLVQAFKFTDEHGEVCPAGWKPGKKTMKPNAEGVAKYLGEN